MSWSIAISSLALEALDAQDTVSDQCLCRRGHRHTTIARWSGALGSK